MIDHRSTDASKGLLSLFAEIWADLKLLARQQLCLAAHEVQYELNRLVRIIGSLIGLIIGAQMLALLAAAMLIAILHEIGGLTIWLSSLLVMLAYGTIVLAIAAYMKRQLSRFRGYPFRTFFTLKEDAVWIREQIASRKT